MKEKKMTLQQFQHRFKTEKACVKRLFELRWPDGYRCPKCGHSRYSFHSTRRLYQCSKCKYQVSVTAGTIFHKTRTSLVHWFWMIFMMTRQKSGVSMLSLQAMLGLKSYRTVWTISHKIRKAMADRDSQYQLTGLVETLETLLKSTSPSSPREETQERRSIAVEVQNRGLSPSLTMMRQVPGSAIGETERAHADSPTSSDDKTQNDWSQNEHEEGFHKCYDDLCPLLISDRKPKGIRWPRILLANLTGNIRGVHHGVSEKHLHRYLVEFLYRFSRRAQSSQLPDRALLACVSASTTTYAELKA